MNTEPTEGVYSVPIRRTRWTSFWIGMAAQFVSLLLAAAFIGLVLLLSTNGNGALLLLIAFGIWWGGFFFSIPLQKRYSRSFDLGRPGIRLVNDVLTVPVSNDLTLQFKLDEPHELRFGWFEVVMPSTGPTTNTRAVVTYATLSQAERHVFLVAEESVREAQAAGWSSSARLTQTAPVVRLWAKDIVALVETIRTRSSSTVVEPVNPWP